MHYLGFAENTHDSCLTLASEERVLVHLELERLLGVKRARVLDTRTVVSAASLLLCEQGVDDDITLVLSRHTAESLSGEIVRALRARLPVTEVLDVEHFDAHAAFGALSGGEEALVLVMDGGGDRLIKFGTPNAEVFDFVDGRVHRQGNLFGADDVGIDGRAWAIVAHRLFGDVHAAGKVMGLAAYGDPRQYRSLVLSKRDDFLHWAYGDDQLAQLARALPGETFQEGADLAAALQAVFTESIATALGRFTTNATTLVISGGCALNVLTNSVLADELPFARCVVPPCPGDEGQSFGAVLYAAQEAGTQLAIDGLPFLGRGSGDDDVPESVYRAAARLLARGKAVAFHVGRAEVGPRALGHRSILAMPTTANRDRVSVEIKGREAFRPVAPVMRLADATEWFDVRRPSPFMSFSADALELTRRRAPGVVHVDGTARLQTIEPGGSVHLDRLFAELAGLGADPLLINTSLNTAGHPIAQDRGDTERIFLSTDIDAAVIDGRVLTKRDN